MRAGTYAVTGGDLANAGLTSMRHQLRLKTLAEHFVGTTLGHVRSILPVALDRFSRSVHSTEQFAEAWVPDPLFGKVHLTGIYGRNANAGTLAVILHGHGGSALKSYCQRAAKAARWAGFSSLRISLRGADRTGEDIYHAGLTGDIRTFLRQPIFSHYRNVVMIGYSLGGHLALRASLEHIDPRVRAVVAVCPPLDLPAAVAAIDSPARAIYRRYIMAGLNRIYAAVEDRRRAPVPLRIVRRARTFRERDELTIVQRFGFASPDVYYSSVSLAPQLHELRFPALVIVSRHDPILPAASLEHALRRASRDVTVRWVDGAGHIHFPSSTNIGFGQLLGLEAQAMSWLGRYV